MRIGYDFGTGDHFEVPCGKCVGCRLERARAWAVRIEHESALWRDNRFLTLTYADEALPADLSLRYRDFQLFMKRLRRWKDADRDNPVRFFMCGEYGGRTGRPHYHAIMFNLAFPDERWLHNGTARSDLADSIWNHGSVVLGSVTPASAAYVAGYSLKKASRAPILVDRATGEYWERVPEFTEMSRRPGIGAFWYEKFASDLFPSDIAVSADGKRKKVPRYYFEKFKRTNPGRAEDVAERRYLRALEGVRAGESSPERREVREEFALRKEEAFHQREL